MEVHKYGCHFQSIIQYYNYVKYFSIICTVHLIIYTVYIYTYIYVYMHTYTHIYIYRPVYVLLFQFGNQQEPPQPFSLTRKESFTSSSTSNATSMSDNKTFTNRYIPPGATCVLPPLLPVPKKPRYVQYYNSSVRIIIK